VGGVVGGGGGGGGWGGEGWGGGGGVGGGGGGGGGGGLCFGGDLCLATNHGWPPKKGGEDRCSFLNSFHLLPQGITLCRRPNFNGDAYSNTFNISTKTE